MFVEGGRRWYDAMYPQPGPGASAPNQDVALSKKGDTVSESVRIYGKETCPYTTAAREEFGKRGVKVEFFDVIADSEAMKRFLELSGGERRVPLIEEAGKVRVGFNGT